MFKENKVSFEFEQYKSFSGKYNIPEIKPINIIIGRNNTGKSAILDVIEYLKGDPPKRENFLKRGTRGVSPSVWITKNLTQDELKPAFEENRISSDIGNHWAYAVNNYLSRPIKIKIEDRITISELKPEISKEHNDIRNNLETHLRNPFNSKRVMRLLADRNIFPEKTSPGEKPAINPDGVGATRAIHHILTYNEADSKIIEIDVINAFNKIFNPDIRITNLITKEFADDTKEIYLEEENKGQIPLSSSGSGIKTVILVLLYTIAYVKYYKTDLADYIFLFEELENNLHAHALRNLFSYLKELAVDKGCTFFITTHSSTVIDLFDNDTNAQIIHVYQRQGESSLEVVNKWLDKSKVIDDLGIRGSDLLQANGIIWVEGPSDRIYINKWINLLSHGEFQEGTHYQCLFYGGRLLSNLKASDPIVEEYVAMLKVNRKLAVVMDSDRSGPKGVINKTKQRIKKEVQSISGGVWITQGREIENYIPIHLLNEVIENLPKNFGKYSKISDLKLPSNSKVILAREIAESMNIKDLEYLDLLRNIRKLIKLIHEWNN